MTMVSDWTNTVLTRRSIVSNRFTRINASQFSINFYKHHQNIYITIELVRKVNLCQQFTYTRVVDVVDAVS